ncbi:MAG: putative porin [Cytophagales bacterium]
MSDSVSSYGYKSTFYFKEENYLHLDSGQSVLDTNSWKNLYDYIGQTDLKKSFQFLGVLGTASRELYRPVENKIGFRNGWDVYDHLQLKSENNLYFAPRSPYTRLNYLQSSTGENRLETTFSRSISQNVQFGFQLNRFTSRKNIGLLGQRSLDKLSDHYNFMGYFALKTKNEHYRALISCAAMRHWTIESGGLIHPLDRTLKKDSIIESFITQPVYFNTNNSTRTISELNKIRLFHDFAPFERRMRVYHIADLSSERNAFYTASFPDINNQRPNYRTFFENAFFDTTSTNYYLKNRMLENELGLSFRNQVFFMNAFISRNDFGFEEVQNQDNFSDSARTGQPQFSSQFLGMKAMLFLSDKFTLKVQAKYQISFSSSEKKFEPYFYNRNDFENKVSLVHKNLELGVSSMQVSPNLLQTYIRSNHFIWANDFKAQNINSIFSTGDFFIKNRHRFRWHLEFQSINHLVYYDQKALPQQSNQNINLSKIGLFYGLRLWKFHFDNQLIYAQTNRKELIRVPEINAFNKTYFESFLFKKALNIQIGVLSTYQSSYLGLAYMPATQTFHLQDQFQTQGFPNISPFVCGKIKNAVLWARMVHMNQRLTNGYFETPNYPALRTSFVFGINWEFFN